MINETRYFILDKPSKKFRFNDFLKYYLKSIYLKNKLRFFSPIYHEKKYKVSLCAIFKNEALYLKEWIEFHKIIGVNHFYLYNNFSTDSYMSVLEPYIADNTVTFIDFPVQQGQMKAYKDCIARFKDETEWIGFIDLDEFIVPKEDDSLYDFLLKFKNYPSVQIYWKIFGTSGLMRRKSDKKDLVTENFTVCWKKYDSIGKCFFNTSFDFDPNDSNNKYLHHKLWGKYKNQSIPPVNHDGNFLLNDFNVVYENDFPIQINHYFTKSYEEYIEKASKGDVYFKDNPHNFDYFYRHEMKCMATDYSAYKYLIKLKNTLGGY